MRLLIDAILGILACVSVTFPWFTKAGWQAGILYAVVAVVLLGLMLLLHLKPYDKAEKLLSAAEVRSLNSLGQVKDNP